MRRFLVSAVAAAALLAGPSAALAETVEPSPTDGVTDTVDAATPDDGFDWGLLGLLGLIGLAGLAGRNRGDHRDARVHDNRSTTGRVDLDRDGRDDLGRDDRNRNL